jgi:hypothetical protein
MASDIYAFVKFSDGSVASLVADGATAKTATECVTGGTGLNQVAGVSIGQAYSGRTAVAALVSCQLDATVGSTHSLCYAYFQSPQGVIMSIANGGGNQVSGFQKLAKPVLMQTGVTFVAAYQTAVDGPSQCSVAVVCASGKCDVFTVLGVADTKTAMTNKDGSTIGQALAGEVLMKVYATSNSTKGLNEDGAGVSAFFIESAEGQLKHMLPPANGGASNHPLPWIEGFGTRIEQNDTLSVTATT